jgi:hypothetical protein
MTHMSDEERKRREEEMRSGKEMGPGTGKYGAAGEETGRQMQAGGAQKQIQVQRDDGSTEPFDREKLMKSVENAGAPRDQAQQIASSIEQTGRPTITMSEIDRNVSTMLQRMNPDAHKNWMQWKEEHGKMR